jgi:hypothetical protein
MQVMPEHRVGSVVASQGLTRLSVLGMSSWFYLSTRRQVIFKHICNISKSASHRGPCSRKASPCNQQTTPPTPPAAVIAV